MKDETLGRRVCWIEDHEGCQDIAVRKSFLHMGNEAAKDLLLRFAWTQKAMIYPFSRCCLLWHFSLLYCLFLEEPFTTPFSVFLFLFAVNLVKSIFQNPEVRNWSACKTETCLDVKNKPFDWLSKQCNTTTLHWPHEPDAIYSCFSWFSLVSLLFQVEIN